jgi:hypothetical protein
MLETQCDFLSRITECSKYKEVRSASNDITLKKQSPCIEYRTVTTVKLQCIHTCNKYVSNMLKREFYTRYCQINLNNFLVYKLDLSC